MSDSPTKDLMSRLRQSIEEARRPTEDEIKPIPVHDPGLDHLLEEVAVEVLRQDAAGMYVIPYERIRAVALRHAAMHIRSVRAIDQAAGGEQP